MKMHESEKPFQCKVCNKAFKRKLYLTRHISFVHDGKRPFKCDICNLGCKTIGELSLHKTEVHKGKQPYKCEICLKRFSRRSHKFSS